MAVSVVSIESVCASNIKIDFFLCIQCCAIFICYIIKYKTNLDCPFSSYLLSDGASVELSYKDSDKCYPNITLSVIQWDVPLIYTYWSVENSATC